MTGPSRMTTLNEECSKLLRWHFVQNDNPKINDDVYGDDDITIFDNIPMILKSLVILKSPSNLVIDVTSSYPGDQHIW